MPGLLQILLAELLFGLLSRCNATCHLPATCRTLSAAGFFQPGKQPPSHLDTLIYFIRTTQLNLRHFMLSRVLAIVPGLRTATAPFSTWPHFMIDNRPAPRRFSSSIDRVDYDPTMSYPVFLCVLALFDWSLAPANCMWHVVKLTHLLLLTNQLAESIVTASEDIANPARIYVLLDWLNLVSCDIPDLRYFAHAQSQTTHLGWAVIKWAIGPDDEKGLTAAVLRCAMGTSHYRNPSPLQVSCDALSYLYTRAPSIDPTEFICTQSRLWSPRAFILDWAAPGTVFSYFDHFLRMMRKLIDKFVCDKLDWQSFDAKQVATACVLRLFLLLTGWGRCNETEGMAPMRDVAVIESVVDATVAKLEKQPPVADQGSGKSFFQLIPPAYKNKLKSAIFTMSTSPPPPSPSFATTISPPDHVLSPSDRLSLIFDALLQLDYDVVLDTKHSLEPQVDAALVAVV
ncbi:hypothetical protein BCR44DRAFT_1516082 [Catenaria anguillulae PL171]|uniref:Uncharacterized protein n=1 Tax=Catenaria anguillulae PL171 TaxID=765915 RepID=A0A1Y2HCS3_9FUNG|nr:hypothetical protein BCR44DRAFT_1516082 [Catenaria anguillulae PL171]